MKKLIIQTMIFTFSVQILAGSVLAQDERFFREMIVQSKSNLQKEQVAAKWKVSTPLYQIDLNDDKIPEGILVRKKDTTDYFYILNTKKETMYETSFMPLGFDSTIFKVTKHRLKDNLNLLIIYYFEGVSRGIEYSATGRLYFLTYTDLFQDFAIFAGPSFLVEKKDRLDFYYRRIFKVELNDFDKDGTKEVSLSHQYLNKIYRFKENVWKEVN